MNAFPYLTITSAFCVFTAFLGACDESPSSNGGPDSAGFVEPATSEALSPLDDICVLSDTDEAVSESPRPVEQACDWTETQMLPPDINQADLDSVFEEGTWLETLTWLDGTQREVRFTLSNLHNQRVLIAKDGLECEPVVRIEADVTLELPEQGLSWTRSTTLSGPYSLLVWSMGGVVSFVVDELSECDHRLLYSGRQNGGPESATFIAEDRETGLQGVVARQDER